MWTTTTCTVLGLVLLSRTLRDTSTPVKTPVLVRLVCTLVPRSASVALYEQTVISSARTTEGFRALNCTCFGTFQSSAGVLGGHIPALLGAPHCTRYSTALADTVVSPRHVPGTECILRVVSTIPDTLYILLCTPIIPLACILVLRK